MDSVFIQWKGINGWGRSFGMGHFIALLTLGIALSLDSFGTGLVYGLKKMNIPFLSIAVISFCTATALFISTKAGQLIQKLLSPEWASRIGGIILILIGLFIVMEFIWKEVDHHSEKTMLTWEISSLGVVIQILRKPMQADLDQSGTVSGYEAFILGFALSIDALGAGIGAAMLGFSAYYLAASAAIMSCLFLLMGLKVGQKFSQMKWVKRISLLPGLLLIIIGIFKM